MPKLKTHSSAKKRLKVTGSGKVVYKQAHSRHRLMQKPKSMKRKARGTAILQACDAKGVLTHLLPHSKRTRKPNPAPASSATAAE